MSFYLYSYILKMLELKTLDLKMEMSTLSINDVTSYYLEVILNKRKISNLQEAAYHIFNIKLNILMEYLNNKLIINKNVTLDDFKEMFENE